MMISFLAAEGGAKIPPLQAEGWFLENVFVIPLIMAISFAVILFFGGLLMAAIMFMIGRTEYLKYGLVGAGLGGLAWVIVTTFFQAGSGVDPGIQLQNF